MNLGFLLAALTMLGAGELHAQMPRPIPNGVVREGTLSFDGRATTGAFTGTTRTVRGEMSGGRSLSEVRGWVDAPVSTLVTGNGHRDRDLNKSMQSEIYPTIRFELTGVAPTAGEGDSAEVILQGRLTIHGVTHEASIPATVISQPGAIRVRGATPLNLKDYRIGGLSKLAGMLKMDDKILVHIDLTFAAGATTVGSAMGTSESH
ncbi:MAG TPA: YceI family protein [Gemmatimonadales bacterium]|jgi:polyisoprenoid-binding protein YceI|nr:YceI family protein [Gemmatimonadales bacterium]